MYYDMDEPLGHVLSKIRQLQKDNYFMIPLI
jgi:hypothetical protein